MPSSTPSATTPRVATSDSDQRRPPHLGVAPERAEVRQRQRGGDDHTGERRLREIRQERVQEEEQDRDEAGADDAGELRLRARLLRHGGARSAGGDREALEEPGGDVRGADADHLLVRLQLVAAPRREARRGGDRVGERHEHDADRREQRAGRRRRPTSTATTVSGSPGAACPRWRRPRTARSRTADTIVAPATATRTAGMRVVILGSTSRTTSTPTPTAIAPACVASRCLDERPQLVDEPVGVGGEAEQLRQLADDDRDREAVHVADLHLAREQVGDEAQLGDAEPDLDEADEQAPTCRRARSPCPGRRPPAAA